MKIKLIFGLLAGIGALVLFLFDKQELGLGFATLIWGIYQKFTKTEVEKEVVEEKEKRLSAEIKLAEIRNNNLVKH